MTLKPGIYTRSTAGHRGQYLNFALNILGGEQVNRFGATFHRAPVLFLMADDLFIHYAATALFRSFFGMRTVGLLFRPAPVVSPKSLKLKIKRGLLKILLSRTNVKTLTIVPFDLAPEFSEIADSWIHDFQLWDFSPTDRKRFENLLNSETSSENNELLAKARSFAKKRPLLVALGMQNRSKGIELLTASMREGGTSGWAVLVAGRFDDASASARDEIESLGGMVIDRYLSDEEIESVYAAATAVWCLYDPAYDQASGILGRAAQLGLPAIVRRGSLSEKLCQMENIPHSAALGGADLAEALASLPPPKNGHAQALSTRMASESTLKLRTALGLSEKAGA